MADNDVVLTVTDNNVGAAVTINHTCLLEEANKAYLSLVSTFNDKVINGSYLLDESNDTSRIYRGLLLGWTCEDGATVKELLTGRLQHDVGYSEVHFEIDNCCVKKSPLPKLTNKDIVDELCNTVKLQLKGYSSDNQLKFSMGTRQINRAVVVALFDVGKRNNIRMNELQISYETRTKMIDKCLEWCLPQKQVNPKIAKSVYLKYIGDPFGHQSPVVDLNVATKGFGQYLERVMRNEFLDVTMGITSQDDAVRDLPNNQIMAPKVRIHNVKTSTDIHATSFSVVVVDNFVSPHFAKKWIKRLNELAFTSGKGGKKNAFVRNVSTTNEPAPILIGSNLVYSGLVPDCMETDLLKIATHLAEMQQRMIENVYPRYKVTWHCNLIHTVAAAIHHSTYGCHSDANCTLCSNPEPEYPHIHVKDGVYLPRQKEMQVATMVFSNCEDKFSTELVYTEANDNKNILKRIQLSNCCLHWQGPGSQALGIHHQAKVLRNIATDGVFRLHSTFRFTLDPKDNKEDFNERLSQGLKITVPSNPSEWTSSYDQKGVIDKCTNCAAVTLKCSTTGTNEMPHLPLEACAKEVVLGKVHHKCPGGADHQIYVDLYSNALNDCYDQLNVELYEEHVTVTGLTKIRLAGTMVQELTKTESLKFLYDAGYLVNVQTSRSKKSVPCLHEVTTNHKQQGISGDGETMEIPVPGNYYPLATICAQAGLVHKSRSHRIYNPRAGNQRVMILSQSYKNDSRGIQEYLSRLDKRKEGILNPSQFYDDEFDGTICIHGSGGSPTIPGDIPPDADINTKYDPMIIIPSSQKMSTPLNIALLEMVMGSEVLTIYVNEALFDGSTEHNEEDLSTNKALCRCLGVFSADEFVVRKDSEQRIVASHCTDPLQKQIYARFKLAPYITVILKPFLTNSDLNLIWQRDLSCPSPCPRKRKRRLIIPVDCQEFLECAIPAGRVMDAASLTPGKMVLRSSIIEEFVRSGRIKKYLTEADDDLYIDANLVCGEATLKDPTDSCVLQVKEKGVTADVKGMLQAIVMCSVAGAHRYKKMCFQHDNENKLCARPLLKACGLPEVYRIHPMPMPNRALDVISIGLRSDLIRDNTFLRCQTDVNSRIKYQLEYHNDLIGTLFKSIVLRFTGRLNSFVQYSVNMKKKTILPNIADTNDFLNFVGCTLSPKTTLTQTIPRWISEQHKHSIPKETRYFTGFSHFIVTIGGKLEKGTIVQEMIQNTEIDKDNRLIACALLGTVLRSCSQSGDENKLNFLAHQIMSDVEEIFDAPFGPVEPEHMHAGSGAQQGFKMLRNSINGKLPVDLTQAIQLVIKSMHENVPEQHLDLMGFERRGSKDDRVMNKVNGRPFNATDAEHFLCKLWLVAKYTLPASTITKQAEATKPHCHPVLMRGWTVPPDPSIEQVMEDILRGYEIYRADMKVPSFCLLPNE